MADQALGQSTATDAFTISQQMIVRRWVFFGVFACLWIVFFLVDVALRIPGLEQISYVSISELVHLLPTIKSDIPIYGDLLPALLGGLVAAGAQASTDNRQLFMLLACTIVTYLMYVEVTVLLSATAESNRLTAKILKELPGWGLGPADLDAIRWLAGAVRNFALTVFAALIGIKLNTSDSKPMSDETLSKLRMTPPKVAPGTPRTAPTQKDAASLGPSGIDPAVPASDESGTDNTPVEGVANG